MVYICSSLLQLTVESRDLSLLQAEKIHKMKTLFNQNFTQDPRTILSENSCLLVNFLACNNSYRIVASSITSRLEAHPGFYRLLMKGFLMLMYYDFLTKS